MTIQIKPLLLAKPPHLGGGRSERRIQKQTWLNSENGPHLFVLKKLFLVRFCVVVWVLFSFSLIFCFTSFGDYSRPQYQETTSPLILFDPECRIDPSNDFLTSKRIFSIPFLRAFLITLIRKISFPNLFRRTIKRNKIDVNIRAQKGENAEKISPASFNN